MKRPLTSLAIGKLRKPGRYAVGNGVYLQIKQVDAIDRTDEVLAGLRYS